MNRQRRMKRNNSLSISKLEKDYLEEYSSIIGIDEVGRGSIAGPLVLAGFKIDSDTKVIPGVNDSKKLSILNRERIYNILLPSISSYYIFVSEVENLNKNGLSNEIKRGINEIHNKLKEEKSITIVDGNYKQTNPNIISVIKADSILYSVACASNIAKVYRDNLMYKFAKEFPIYEFEKNVGYGTKNHFEAIKKYGITKLHRTNFEPIKGMLLDQKTFDLN